MTFNDTACLFHTYDFLSGNPITLRFAFVWHDDVEIASSSWFIDHSSASNWCIWRIWHAGPDGLERARKYFFRPHPASRYVFFPSRNRTYDIGLTVYSCIMRHHAPLNNNKDRPRSKNNSKRYSQRQTMIEQRATYYKDRYVSHVWIAVIDDSVRAPSITVHRRFWKA